MHQTPATQTAHPPRRRLAITGRRPHQSSILLAALLLAACGSSSAPQATPAGNAGDELPQESTLRASITRTEFGIPHIVADDFSSLGFGFGYAFAEDNLCVLLEDLVAIRGERSRFFGRDGSYVIPANGTATANVDSDFFWKLMANDAAIARLREAASQEVRDATAGYAAGVNRFIRELQAGEHPGRHAACRDAEWLAEITLDDMYRRYFRLGVLASSSALATEIATASPPLLSPPEDAAGAAALAKAAQQEAVAALQSGDLDAEDLPFPRELPIGSNMYALGGSITESGESMVFGNPHFPWAGTERLYIAHLTIPGRIDIMGSTLYGVPAILIGFNNHFAWSHTVSTAFRFGLYQLSVNPANPRQYFFDGELLDMEQVPLSIEVMEADGSISSESRTLHRSRFGPILELSVAGVPVLGWDNTRAFAMRDANAENDRLLDQFFGWNQAQSLDEFKRLHADILGIPWVNTIASGPGGVAYYGDVSVVPNVPDALVAECQPAVLGPVLANLVPGLPLLRGNSSDCDWRSDDDAPAPGIFGPGNLPVLERADWVTNCNDSHWLTNPAEPLTGFARIIGPEESERTLRTRLCIRQIQDRLDGSDGLDGTRFSFEQLQTVVLNAQNLSERLTRDTVLAELCDDPELQAACDVLAAWDGTGSPDARGAHLWREFWREALAAGDNLWQTPFSVDDPVNTPRDLNTGNPTVQNALPTAVERIEGLGIALDERLDALQISGVSDADGAPIPVPGGEQFEGAFTIAGSDTLSEAGYPVDFGNSYIQAVTWEDGRVRAEGFITYSQSTDPASPHFSDFTQAYAQRRWHRFPFTAEDIQDQAISTTTLP